MNKFRVLQIDHVELFVPDRLEAAVWNELDHGARFRRNSLHSRGRYITVWRKEPDGQWRCSFDISNEGPAPVAASTELTAK